MSGCASFETPAWASGRIRRRRRRVRRDLRRRRERGGRQARSADRRDGTQHDVREAVAVLEQKSELEQKLHGVSAAYEPLTATAYRGEPDRRERRDEDGVLPEQYAAPLARRARLELHEVVPRPHGPEGANFVERNRLDMRAMEAEEGSTVGGGSEAGRAIRAGPEVRRSAGPAASPAAVRTP